ncbi:pyridoxine 5'-phosphate synthase [Saprospiraceae bacterium]|nr:pyridoxine 5'-phosphate synthase [Saprospiraceae bacterium]MDC3209931.1 pyridoxine 5'-phosphate synthase [Saprospiraceae bacterium]MDC3253403.1 pyridoxine 5'-phosphate synthase [bacterium]MDG1435284.1 pyridoxine 5'-phosphate synthase [Saprospiraceae bacterium]
MTRLSINLNKVALIRNARGGNLPNLEQVAIDCEKFGAQGITVHPRPDERHITFADIPKLKALVTTEFNIEGNPTPHFINLVLKNKPHQCTLVPDDPNQLTSDHGWNTIENESFLTEIIAELKEVGIRTSLFVDPEGKMVEGAKKVGADRIELYTGNYASNYINNKYSAVKPFTEAAKVANDIGIGINAGHDLNLDNLEFFQKNVSNLLEVSIGQAFVSDALYFGLYNTVQLYLRELK